MKTFSQLEHPQQLAIFSKVFELNKQGLGYKRIIKKLIAEDEVRLSKGTLSYWFNHDVKMIGGENAFEAKPSPELSYILGVLFGDGSVFLNKKKQDYFLSLSVKDKDFAEKFSGCGAKILNKEKTFAAVKEKPRHFSAMYTTRIRSKQLYNFVKAVKEDFEKAKPFIEEFSAEFVRGLADSEGTACVSVGKTLSLSICVAVSTNSALLEYVKNLLLQKYALNTLLRKNKTAGMKDSVINGRIITRTKDLFALNVSRNSNKLKYGELIGFGINRKQTKINDFKFLKETYANSELVTQWKKMYTKVGRYWIRNNQLTVKSNIYAGDGSRTRLAPVTGAHPSR